MEGQEGRSRESALPRSLHQYLLGPDDPSMVLPPLVMGRETGFEGGPPGNLPRLPQFVGVQSLPLGPYIPQGVAANPSRTSSHFSEEPHPSTLTPGPAFGLHDYRLQHNLSNNYQSYTPTFNNSRPPSNHSWGAWQEGEAGPSSLLRQHRIGGRVHEPHRYEYRGIAPVPRGPHGPPYEYTQWPESPPLQAEPYLGRGSSGPITPPRRGRSLGAAFYGEPPPYTVGTFEHKVRPDGYDKSEDGEAPLGRIQEPLPRGEGRKRRRVFKKTPIACKFCRLRKLRCNGARPECHNCTLRKQNCDYDPMQRRRGPGKAPKGPKGKRARVMAGVDGQKGTEERGTEEKEGGGESA